MPGEDDPAPTAKIHTFVPPVFNWLAQNLYMQFLKPKLNLP